MRPPVTALALLPALAGGLFFSPVRAGEEPALEEFQLDALRVARDPDGHTNLRAGPGVDHKIIGKVKSGAVIAIEDAAGKGWAKRAGDGGEQEGYLHTSRLEKLTSWRETAAQPAPDGKSAEVAAGEFRATVAANTFSASRHTIAKQDDQVETIDGRIPWGVDGGMPSQSLTLRVTLAGKSVAIPAAATSDLYQPNLETLLLLRPKKENDPVVLVMSNGDGAGFYTIAWSFSGGAYTGRAILPAP